jgi:hypothetical protein
VTRGNRLAILLAIPQRGNVSFGGQTVARTDYISLLNF